MKSKGKTIIKLNLLFFILRIMIYYFVFYFRLCFELFSKNINLFVLTRILLCFVNFTEWNNYWKYIKKWGKILFPYGKTILTDKFKNKSMNNSSQSPEIALATAKATVMIYDDTNKKWLPSGSSPGLSKVQLLQHSQNGSYRVVGRKIPDHEVNICLS